LARVWDAIVETGHWDSAAFALAWSADAALLLGEPAAIAPLAGRVDAVPGSAHSRLMRIGAGRIRARHAAAAGAEDLAADAFGDALAAARSYGRRVYLASVLADYGLWLVECGRSEEAEPLLDEARALFEGMGAQRWLDLIASAPTAATAASLG
jgi:hypothetical protein